jgi:CRP/FNR family transcriptional regulator, cyclic AMP receptor protein
MAEIELREVPLFSEMDEQEVAGIRAIMDEMKFKPGQVIIREGELGNLFYVVTAGQVEVIVRDADGSDVILHKAGPGDFFGELSMLTNEPRSARVRAVEPVTVLALERDEFFNFLRMHTHAAIDVLVELGGRLHENDRILRSMVSRNVNEVEEERMTFGQRVADRVADTIGSWPFIIVQTVILTIWIILNITAWVNRWDPYPFILLNLMLSFQAAYSGPVIMMSQNRQSAKDRLAAEIDHQVNAKAELEINNLMRRLDELEINVEENHVELKRLLSTKKKRSTGAKAQRQTRRK